MTIPLAKKILLTVGAIAVITVSDWQTRKSDAFVRVYIVAFVLLGALQVVSMWYWN